MQDWRLLTYELEDLCVYISLSGYRGGVVATVYAVDKVTISEAVAIRI
jgi:hypothetical protein